MNGRTSVSLYAAFTNIAQGVDPERFRVWYEDIHRPDSIERGIFTASSRYRAATPSQVDYLTLWEGSYPDFASALAGVRPQAEKLRAEGRVWPVQEVVYHQFLFQEPGSRAGAAGDRVRSVTTLQNDWRRPAKGQRFEQWWREAVEGAPLDAYHAIHLYAVYDRDEPDVGKFLAIGESDQTVEALQARWPMATEYRLTPLGAPTPIFVVPGEEPPLPEPPDSSPAARRSLYVVHWTPTESS